MPSINLSNSGPYTLLLLFTGTALQALAVLSLFSIWAVRTTDLEWPLFLSFHGNLGDDHLVLGRYILRLCNPNRSAQCLTLPYGNFFPYILLTCDDPPSISSPWTYIYLLPTHSKSFRSVLTSFVQLYSSSSLITSVLPELSQSINLVNALLIAYTTIPTYLLPISKLSVVVSAS